MFDVRFVWVGAPGPYVPWTVLTKQAWGWMQSCGLFKHSHLPSNVMTPSPHTPVCRTVFLSYCDMRTARCTRFAWRSGVVWRSDVTSCDGLTSRFTRRTPAVRHIHVKNYTYFCPVHFSLKPHTFSENWATMIFVLCHLKTWKKYGCFWTDFTSNVVADLFHSFYAICNMASKIDIHKMAIKTQ